jgi:Uma2 family endonuclease
MASQGIEVAAASRRAAFACARLRALSGARGAVYRSRPAMKDLAPSIPSKPTLISVDHYLGLVEDGELGPDDRVELLEGVLVAMAPQNPPHAAAVAQANQALARAIGERTHVRPQLSLVLDRSVPEPDLAVVSGSPADYANAHPTTALLVVEVADSSLKQDRLSKAAIYAAAGIPEYWIVNLRDELVEVMRDPDPERACYRAVRSAARGERLELVALPGAALDAAALLPRVSG